MTDQGNTSSATPGGKVEAQAKRKRLAWFAFCVTVFTYAFLAYLKLLDYFHEGTLFAFVKDGHPYVKDFCNTYNGALLAERCLHSPINIYDPVIQDQSLREVIKPVVPELPFYLQYPPCYFALVLPLSLFPLSQAWTAWVLTATVLIFISTPLLLQGSRFTSRKARLMAVLAVMSSFPTWFSYSLGQTTLYTYPAVVYLLTRLLVGKGFSSGLAGVWAFVKLQYAPVLVLAGLSTGKMRFLAGAATACLFLVALSVAILGVDNVLIYPHVLLGGETGTDVSGVSAESMQNLRGQLTLLMVPSQFLFKMVLAGFALGLLFTAWLWLKVYPRKAPTPRRFQIFAALSLLIALTVSPHTHVQDYMLAVMSAVWIWINYESTGGPRAKWLCFLCVSFIPYGWITFIAGQFLAALRAALPAGSAAANYFWLVLPPIEPLLLWSLAVQVLLLRDIFSDQCE